MDRKTTDEMISEIRDSDRKARFLIFTGLLALVIGLVLLAFVIYDSQQQIIEVQKTQEQQSLDRTKAVTNIIEETQTNTKKLLEATENQTIILCTIIRGAHPELTEEEIEQVRSTCEIELERLEEQDNQNESSDEPTEEPTDDQNINTHSEKPKKPKSNNRPNWVNDLLDSVRKFFGV